MKSKINDDKKRKKEEELLEQVKLDQVRWFLAGETGELGAGTDKDKKE